MFQLVFACWVMLMFMYAELASLGFVGCRFNGMSSLLLLEFMRKHCKVSEFLPASSLEVMGTVSCYLLNIRVTPSPTLECRF